MNNLAMKLTWFRLFISPVFAWLYFQESQSALIFTFVIAILVEVSDILDGYIARKRNQVSDLGKVLDPLADQVTHLTFFLCFAWANLVPLWMILLILYREALIATLRTVCAYQGIVVAARKSGKIKTVFQAVGVIIILFGKVMETFISDLPGITYGTIYFIIMLAVTIVTVYSGYDYLIGQWPQLKKIFNQRS